MQRMEKKKRVIHLIVVALMLLSPVLVWVRVVFASFHISTQSMVDALDIPTGYICDREGNIISGRDRKPPAHLGNLIGFTNSYGYDMIRNSISSKLSYLMYSDVRANPIRGFRVIQDDVVKSLNTTLLPLDSQKRLYDAFQGYDGELLAYNYKTGEVLCALSLPSANVATDTEGDSHINRSVNSLTDSHGSTMKIPTLVMAYEAGLDLESFRYSCSGRRILPDGGKVDCLYAHGSNLDIQTVIGKSCNCAMSVLVEQFDKETIREILLNMQFELRDFSNYEAGEKRKPDLDKEFLDRTLARYYSEIQISDFGSERGSWTFYGQGDCMVSPLHMAMIAGAIVNGGAAAEPVYIRQVTSVDQQTLYKDFTQDEPVYSQLFSQEAADYARQTWSRAHDGYYSQYFNGDVVTMSKTGTSQNTGAPADRALLLVMEEYDVAVYIGAHYAGQGNMICFDIANALIAELERCYVAPSES